MSSVLAPDPSGLCSKILSPKERRQRKGKKEKAKEFNLVSFLLEDKYAQHTKTGSWEDGIGLTA